MTFVEACVAGTPLITTTSGDHLPWIDGKVGYVVDPRTDSLGLALQDILRDEDKRRAFSEEARRIVLNEFNWEVICQTIEKHYLQALKCSYVP